MLARRCPVIIARGMNLIHVVSLIHESSERCYSGTSPRIRDVPTEPRGNPQGSSPGTMSSVRKRAEWGCKRPR